MKSYQLGVLVLCVIILVLGVPFVYSRQQDKTSDEFRNQFVNAPSMEFMLVKTGDRKKIDSEIVAISGATISSQAVVDMINVFLPQVKAQMQAEGLISDGQ